MAETSRLEPSSPTATTPAAPRNFRRLRYRFSGVISEDLMSSGLRMSMAVRCLYTVAVLDVKAVDQSDRQPAELIARSVFGVPVRPTWTGTAGAFLQGIRTWQN